MKLLYVYNPDSEIERNTLKEIKEKMPLDNQLEAISFMHVKDKYAIGKTPTLIITMDNLVVDGLLERDEVSNELEIVCLLERMNNLEFHSQFNSETAKLQKEQEIEAKVSQKITEIVSSDEVVNTIKTVLENKYSK